MGENSTQKMKIYNFEKIAKINHSFKQLEPLVSVRPIKYQTGPQTKTPVSGYFQQKQVCNGTLLCWEIIKNKKDHF